MKRSQVKPSSVVSAVALSLVTLATFWTFRNYGPESTIRRFHQAVLDNKFRDIEFLVTPESDPRAVAQLRGAIRQFAASGASLQYRARTSGTKLVRAEVLYIFPNGMTIPMVYVTEKRGTNWLLNCNDSFAQSWQRRLVQPNSG